MRRKKSRVEGNRRGIEAGSLRDRGIIFLPRTRSGTSLGEKITFASDQVSSLPAPSHAASNVNNKSNPHAKGLNR